MDARQDIAKKIRKIMKVGDTLAGGSYPQCYVWVCATVSDNGVEITRQYGPPGNAYESDDQHYVRFSLDADDCVRYNSGPHAGREAKGRDAVAILADYVAGEIVDRIDA
jgi:hypothetical protein